MTASMATSIHPCGSWRDIASTWETILNNADVGSSEAAVDIFEGIAIISPRGRYTVELHLSFLRLHGQANDIIIIKYSSIVRLFILPKVMSAWHGAGSNDLITFVVVTLDPPVRKGKTLYPHIVIQFPTEVMVETDLNLSRDLLDGKYKDRLEESYMGPMHEVFTEVLGGLSGAKVSTPGSFRTCLDGYAVKTSLKSEHGPLYPHEKGFFFLPKPPMIIPYEEIEFAGFGRYCCEGAKKSSRYFDVLVKRKNDQDHIFRNIERNEYPNLFSFINGKHLKIIHLGDGQAGDEQSDEEDENFDLHMDGGSSTDDSSGDESESSESGGEKEKSSKKEASNSKPPAKRKKCNGMDNEYSEIRKWKKKRCHNVPKRSIPPFMYFSIAERARLKKENPDLPTAEIAMKLGQVWQNMSDEAKQPYIQAEIREKKRFIKKKRATYRWYSMNLREKEIKITYEEEGKFSITCAELHNKRNCYYET